MPFPLPEGPLPPSSSSRRRLPMAPVAAATAAATSFVVRWSQVRLKDGTLSYAADSVGVLWEA